MQVAQSNLEIAYRESGHYDRRVAELQGAPPPQPEDRDARWELGAPTRPRPPPGRRRRVPGAARLAAERRARHAPARARREGAGHLDTATDWLVPRLRPRSRQRRRALLHRRGALQPRPQRAGARRAARGDRAQPRLRRSALSARVRVRRHGPARGGPRGHQARHRAQPDARAGAGQPRARRASPQNGARPRRARAERPQIVEGGRARALQPRARLPAEGPTTRRCASTGWRSTPARTARLTLQAMAEVHLLRRELAGGARALRRAASASTPTRPSCGTSGASACTRPAAAPSAIASYERAVGVDPGYQLAWNNLGVIWAGEAGRRRRSRRSGARSTATGRCSRRGSTSACCSCSGTSSGRARGVPGRARRAERERRGVERRGPRAHGAAPVRGCAQRLRPGGGRRPGHRRRALQPELRPEPAGRLRRRAPRDPPRARARAALRARRSSRSRSTCSTRIRRSRSRPSSTAEVGGDQLAGEFAFDPPALDQLFAELAPARRRPVPNAVAGDALDLARDYIARACSTWPPPS